MPSSQCWSCCRTPWDLAGDRNPNGLDPASTVLFQTCALGVLRGLDILPARNRFEHTPAIVFFSHRVLRSRSSFVNGKDRTGSERCSASGSALENPFTYTIELHCRGPTFTVAGLWVIGFPSP